MDNILHIEQHILQVALVIQGLGDGDWPDWCSQLSHFSNILLVLNSSVNIVIYCWKDPSFRNWIILTKFYTVSFPLSLLECLFGIKRQHNSK